MTMLTINGTERREMSKCLNITEIHRKYKEGRGEDNDSLEVIN